MRFRRWTVTTLLAAAAFAGCGGDDEPASTSSPPAQGADLGAIKAFLLEHTAQLQQRGGGAARGRRGLLRAGRGRRLRLRSSCSTEQRAEVQGFVERSQEAFAARQPGLRGDGGRRGRRALAGRLRRDHRRRRRRLGSRERRAVQHPTPDGRDFKQPGNFNYLIETSLFGTEPKFAAKGVKPDLDGDGRVRVRRGGAGRRLLRRRRARVRAKTAGELDHGRARSGSRRCRTRSPRSWS